MQKKRKNFKMMRLYVRSAFRKSIVAKEFFEMHLPPLYKR